MSTRAPVVPLTRKRRNTNPEPPPKAPRPAKRTIVEMPDYLYLGEAADRLGVSQRTVERYIKNGTLKAHRVFGRKLVLEEDLAVFVRGLIEASDS